MDQEFDNTQETIRRTRGTQRLTTLPAVSVFLTDESDDKGTDDQEADQNKEADGIPDEQLDSIQLVNQCRLSRSHSPAT